VPPWAIEFHPFRVFDRIHAVAFTVVLNGETLYVAVTCVKWIPVFEIVMNNAG